jgi:hypothetical protein
VGKNNEIFPAQNRLVGDIVIWEGKKMSILSKELLGLAGEYAAASELCRRGMYAQLTLGHHKRTDLLVECEFGFVRIQVKAKQGREWPAISGIDTDDDFIVLVDFSGADCVQPDFYILNLSDWKSLLEQEKELYPDIEIDGKLRIRYPDGWKGLNISPVAVIQCKNCWNKILGP